MSIEFLLTSFIVVASPGTGVLYTLAAGLSRGARASVLAAFACTLGIIPHMAAAITGLAALLYTSALAFEVIKYLGVAYLLYMAWSTLQEHGALDVEGESAPKTARQVIVEGILINMLNPKLSIFFFAFLPQFVDTTDPNALPHDARAERRLHGDDVRGLRDLWRLRGGGPDAHRRRPGVLTWMRRSFAAAFVLLGARLALTSADSPAGESQGRCNARIGSVLRLPR